MLKRFQTPLGLVLSYSVFNELIWQANPKIQLLRSIITNDTFTVFLDAISGKSQGTPSALAINEAVTIVNIDLVLLSLAIGFLSSAILLQLLEFLLSISRGLLIALRAAAVDRIAPHGNMSPVSRIAIDLLVYLVIPLLIAAIFWGTTQLPIRDLLHSRHPSLGAILISCWSEFRILFNI